MNTKDYWKIFNADKSVMILTDVPKTYHNGYGAYNLCHHLQKVYGYGLCSIQKFDERFDKIEDFDIILRTGYNLEGNRLISAHLFEYDKEKKTLRVDNNKVFKIIADSEYTFSIGKKFIRCIGEWNGLRKHILWTMGDDSCWRHWGDAQFGKQDIIPLNKKDSA